MREIRRKDVIDLVTAKALTGKTAANRLQAFVLDAVGLRRRSDWLDANPALGLRKRKSRRGRAC